MERVCTIVRRQLLIAVAIAALTALVLAGPAGAHAEVLEADPEIGGEAEEGIGRVELTFIEMDPEGPISVQVLDPSGTDRATGDPTVEGQQLTVPVEPLEVGEHRVVWAVFAADGDGTSDGSFTFTVVEPAGGGFGVWLLWIVALGIPAAIFLRPGARKKS